MKFYLYKLNYKLRIVISPRILREMNKFLYYIDMLKYYGFYYIEVGSVHVYKYHI